MDSFFVHKRYSKNDFHGWRRGGPFSCNLLVVALTVVLLGFSANGFARIHQAWLCGSLRQLMSLLDGKGGRILLKARHRCRASFIFPQSPLLRR